MKILIVAVSKKNHPLFCSYEAVAGCDTAGDAQKKSRFFRPEGFRRARPADSIFQSKSDFFRERTICRLCAREGALPTTTLPKRLKSKEYKFYVLNSTVDKFMRYLHRQTNLQFPVMHKPGSAWSLRGTLVENFLRRLKIKSKRIQVRVRVRV